MDLKIFNQEDRSGKFYKESFMIKNHKKEYDFIVKKFDIDIPFKEKAYLVINDLNDIPKCKNNDCDNVVKFINSSRGYRTYCSKRCTSSDPNIKKSKELKSIKKYGTTHPSKSKEVKQKIIKTNNDIYGGNSPMNNKHIIEKSKKTLLKNHGIENPSKSKEIQEKRIKSFKKSNYKESYKKTSIEKYGVEHPWMDRKIHKKTIDHFYKDYKERIIKKLSDRYTFIDFDKSEGISTNLVFKCNECINDFKILPYQFYHRVNNNLPICTKCYPISENSSISQIELYNFIRENYKGEIIQNDKREIKPNEIDIYLPELRIGFEFNGVFWHSNKFKDNNYHYKKYKKSQENNIKLYTIWEDDWNIKREICKSFILNKLFLSNKIGARKTKIQSVGYMESKSFLEENHLQGDVKSSIRIGLYQDDELLSLMTFSKLRLPIKSNNKVLKNTWELTRFCNKINTSIVGGASKMLKYFINTHKPYEIQTYSDNLISNGDLYERLGFYFKHESKPGYWYVINGIREHRFNWRKQKLVDIGYDKNKTENEIMLELGHHRIYNAGNKKWIYK